MLSTNCTNWLDIHLKINAVTTSRFKSRKALLLDIHLKINAVTTLSD